MTRRILGLLAGVAGAGALLVPTGALGVASHSHTVTLREFRFHPGTLNIRHGDSVKWVWRDEVEHNVTFRTVHSRTQVSGSYSLRFNRKGSFNYRCTIHGAEGMRGKIVVR
jgi:plastocyanin